MVWIVRGGTIIPAVLNAPDDLDIVGVSMEDSGDVVVMVSSEDFDDVVDDGPIPEWTPWYMDLEADEA